MAKDVQVKIRLSGLNKLMRSAPVQAEVNRAAGRVKTAAGDKFQVHPSPHKWVARAFIEAKPDVRTTHADRARLLTALDAAKR